MSNQEKQLREKRLQSEARQRQVRRNQVILVVLSAFLILSMVLSLIVNL